jgi:hypothetical protein
VGARPIRSRYLNARTERVVCKSNLITKKEESSEERSPRVLETEKGFQGSLKGFIKLVARVAKP